jgi:hypothetical protein
LNNKMEFLTLKNHHLFLFFEPKEMDLCPT